jgi:hypothetical protein
VSFVEQADLSRKRIQARASASEPEQLRRDRERDDRLTFPPPPTSNRIKRLRQISKRLQAWEGSMKGSVLSLQRDSIRPKETRKRDGGQLEQCEKS